MKQAEDRTLTRAPLSRERVFAAAVALADEQGLASVTMRAVGDRLGVEAMSLYHHVANKGELLDGMVEVVFGEVELPTTDVDWKEAMRRRAVSTREALGRHRWAVDLLQSATTPGPAQFRVVNAVLECLRNAGFSVEDTVHAYSAQDAYIYGFALQEKNLPVDTPGELAEAAQEVGRQFSAEEYPYIAETIAGQVTRPGYDFADEFRFGLDVILDGFERLRGTG